MVTKEEVLQKLSREYVETVLENFLKLNYHIDSEKIINGCRFHNLASNFQANSGEIKRYISRKKLPDSFPESHVLYLIRNCIYLKNQVDILSNKKLFKIMNKDESYKNEADSCQNTGTVKYTDGPNVLDESKRIYDDAYYVRDYGLQFTDADNLLYYIDHGCYVREIEIPFDDPELDIYQDDYSWKTNKIILGKRYDLKDLITFEHLFRMGVKIRDENMNRYVTNWACRFGYLDILKFLQGRGGDIHSSYCLVTAAEHGQYDVVKYLVEKGVDVNTHFREDLAPLSIAVFNGHYDIAKYLLENGADIHINNDYVFTFIKGWGLRRINELPEISDTDKETKRQKLLEHMNMDFLLMEKSLK